VSGRVIRLLFVVTPLLCLPSRTVADSFDDPAAFVAALSSPSRSEGFDALADQELVSVLRGHGYSEDILGESPMATSAFATASPSLSLGLDNGDAAFQDGDVLSISFPTPMLAVGIVVVTSDPAQAGEIVLLTPFGASPNQAAPHSVFPDGGRAYFVGFVSTHPFSSVSLDFAADGDAHFVYTVDDVTVAAAPVSVGTFEGVAVGGYTIEFMIAGVALQITTSPGQDGSEVADAVSDAINGDPSLEGMGIFAEAQAQTVSTNGAVTSSVINDPGIGPGFGVGPLPLPSLSIPGLLLLCLLLSVAGWRSSHFAWKDAR
jgi:hypothetical protein